MPRISIKSLMLHVAFFAVGLAALRNAGEMWEGIMLLLTLGVFCTCIVALIERRGRKRAWWRGFGVFGFAYLLVAFGPLVSEEFTSRLGSTKLSKYIHDEVRQVSTRGYTVDTLKASYIKRSTELAALKKQPSPNDETMNEIARYENAVAELQDILIGCGDPLVKGKQLRPVSQTRMRLQHLFPGAEDEGAFSRMGHYLSAILAGLVGAAISSRMYQEPTS